MAKFWMIAHVSDGTVLPAPMGRGGRGGTHVEPTREDGPVPPRLFNTEVAAKNALRWWLAGAVTVTQTEYDIGLGDRDVAEHWDVEPDPTRKAEEWHVVPVTIEREVTNG